VKVYICGPMTLNVAPDLNRAAFEDAADPLRELGHDVFNPADNPPDLTYAQCMRVDIAAVLASDAVVVLPRWEEGVGTRVEVAVALAVGTPVYSWVDDGLAELYAANAGRAALAGFLGGPA
jgi:nucleoside 2-deoxyribosyltransferase